MQNDSCIIKPRLIKQSQKYPKYKFDSNYQKNHILSKDFKQTTIQIDLAEWKFFKKGEGHLLFESILSAESNNQKDQKKYYKKLIKIEIQPQKVECFQYFHQRVLTKCPCIQKLVLHSQIYMLQQKNQIQILTKWVNQKKLIKKVFQKINNFQLIDNLTRLDFNFLIQIKPKTPLPEYFNLKFIRQIFTDKFNENKQKNLQFTKVEKNFQLQQMLEQIENCAQIQKTRWFKKNCLKQKKKNLNPLQTFNIHQQKIDFLQHCLSKKEQKVLKQQQQIKINHKIHQQIMKESLFEELVFLHSLCQYPADIIEQFYLTINSQDFLQNLSQNELNQIFNLVIKRIQEVMLQIKKYSSYKQYIKNMFKTPCIVQINKNQIKTLKNIETIAHIFFFLVTLTWKDISLMILTKIGDNLSECLPQNFFIQLKIIDYGIKNLNSIKRNVQKDSQYLLYYWTYKRNLNGKI